ncbi:MAG TPA: asparagine synthase (glutamine-hydrolyzing) [Candidatus Limnocylindrales bacterium]|nr:asparagine synthase (glutamine-hydrolyzing) [Candidatus Limnocylindrales bacterium]
MCGIAGFTRLNGAARRGVAERINEAMYHRGPDEHGVFEGGEATLCAVRLRIIDLAGGHQPIVSDNGDTAIAFNGEIYNHLEIRAELERLGHRFRSQCDTETVLRAFLQWDTGCFAKMRGMFGVALWTESRKRLVLARDRMGIKPLYYCRRGDDIFFGSELKAILAHPEIERRLDLEALDTYLSVNYVPGTRTLVRGIRKLKPGHVLEWRHGTTWMEPWWRPPGVQPRRRSLEEAKEELDGLLKESVREHLISDVPLGVWASGGLDSSAILHYAATQMSGRLKTFSVSFAGRSFDESEYFREVARQYGTDHHEFDLNPAVELEQSIEDFAYYSDEPSADAGALPVWFLSRMSRRHVTVALSGEGADELFGGYLTYVADRLARPLRLVPEFARRAARGALDRYMPVSDEKIGLEYKLKRWLDGSFLHPDEAHFFWNGTFSNEQRRAVRPGCNGNGLRDLVRTLGIQGCGTIDRYLQVDQNYYLADDILYKTDRMSMAHSLEVRPPFLDHRIVEFAATLPEDMKIRGMKQKFLLKELMRGKLPERVLRRKKAGFDIPTHDWFRGPLRRILLDTLTTDAIEATGIFDAAAIHRLIQDHFERRINAGYHLWGLLTLFLWMKRWRVTTDLQEGAMESEPVQLLATR